jgi:hypothetical protein
MKGINWTYFIVYGIQSDNNYHFQYFPKRLELILKSDLILKNHRMFILDEKIMKPVA